MNRYDRDHLDGALETRLRQMLGAQAESVDVAADFTGSAIARRKQTQRRTMIAAGIAGAAALAVAIPVGASLLPQTAPLTPGTGTESALDSTATEQPTDPAPTAATPEPTTATEGATAEATADAPETPADMITAFPDGTPWSEDQITELAPYALGSTLHLPTGTFGIGENRQIIGLLTLRPEGSMSNGNVLVQYLDTGTSDAHLMLIPVGTDSAPIELGTGELVVAGDGSAFALNDGATITVRDSASGVIASQALPGQTVLAVDDSSVFVHNFTDAMRAWNYRTGEITQVTALPALVSDDAATAVRHVYADEEFALEVTDLSTGQVNSLPSGADASQTVNPLRFSADGDYVYNVRGMATNDLTRVADGAWTSPVGVRPDVLSFTMTADGTGLLAVLGQPDESGALQSVLARCDVAATSCETISDPVPYEVADGVFNLGAYVVAIQH